MAVIGLSMGGALAAQSRRRRTRSAGAWAGRSVSRDADGVERAARLAWLWGSFVPVVRSGGWASILDPQERERSLAYGVFTAAALTRAA